MPAFSYRHIKDLQPIFWSQSINMIQAIEGQQRSISTPKGSTNEFVSTVEPNDWASRATLDIIGAAALGRSFKSLNDPSNELNKSYRALFRADKSAIFFGILEFLLPPRFVNNLPVQRNRDLKRNVELVKGVCAEMIEQERMEMKQQQGDDLKDDDKRTSSEPQRLLDQKHGRKHQTILTTAMSSTHHQFTTKELIGQLTTFLIAGHETTAAALSWSIYNLCKYPEMQQKLREEVRQVIPAGSFQHKQGGHESADGDVSNRHGTLPPDLDLTTNLPYLTAFTSEILRLYSPVSATIRQAARDTMLAGQPIPRGTLVGVPIWGINVATNLWDPSNPETKENDLLKFKPERWLGPPIHSDDDSEDHQDLRDGAVPPPSTTQGRGGAKSNYANLTFIHGPRSCIGQSFARSELTCLLAAWVGYFDVEFEDDTKKKEVDGQEKLREKRRLKQEQKNRKKTNRTTEKTGGEEVEEDLVGIGMDMMNGISVKPADGWKVTCHVLPWN